MINPNVTKWIFQIGIISSVASIHLIFLFLLQPSKIFLTKDPQNISIGAAVLGVALSTTFIATTASVFWLRDDDMITKGLFSLLVLFSFVIGCFLNIAALTVFYNRILWKILAKIHNRKRLYKSIPRIKRHLIVLITGICIFSLIQHIVQESENTEKALKNYQYDINIIEDALGVSLKNNAVVLSYDLERTPVNFMNTMIAGEAIIKGNDQFFHALATMYSVNEEQGKFIFEKETREGRHRCRGTCVFEFPSYVCSFHLLDYW